MKKIILLLLGILLFENTYSQSEMSAFTATGRAGAATTFVTDYQSMGINPSNLGWTPKNEKMLSFGLLEGAYSLYSEALVKSELVNSLKKGQSDFTYTEKVQAGKDFTESGFAANIDLTWLAFSVQPNDKFGGLSFGIRERFQWYSRFNKTLSQILFLGYKADYFTDLILANGDTISNSANLPDDTLAMIKKGISMLPSLFSQIIDDSRLSMSWYREYNLSYGRQILSNDKFSVYGGFGLKYLSGMAIMDISTDQGSLETFSAITPAFGINYGDSVSASNPSTVEGGGLLPKTVGTGFGLDVGFSTIVGKKLKIGASVNDIGSITWNGNVYAANDDPLIDMSSPGFASYNLFSEAQGIVGDSGLFTWKGISEKKVRLPTNIRAGASFQPTEKFEVGVDLVLPVNDVAGNYEQGLVAFGVDVVPIPWLRLSTGITSGGNYGFNLPVGVVLMMSEGTWEMGIASRDVITFFSQTKPTLSLSAGFLRFKF